MTKEDDLRKIIGYLEGLVRKLMNDRVVTLDTAEETREYVRDSNEYQFCECCCKMNDDQPLEDQRAGKSWHADDCPYQEALDWFLGKGEGVN